MKYITYSYVQCNVNCFGRIYFVDLSTESFPRCAFFHQRSNRFLQHGHCGQEGFELPEHLDNMCVDVLGNIGYDILPQIKNLIPEGFWDRK